MLSGEKFVYKGFGGVERGQLRGVGYAVGYVPGVVAGDFKLREHRYYMVQRQAPD